MNTLMKSSRLFRALLAGSLLLALAGAPLASAYEGQIVTNITVTGPTGTLKCNTWYSIRATLRDAAGARVPDHSVNWSIVLRLSSGDRLSATTSRTNSQGNAFVNVRLGCVAGPRTVRARADAASGQVVLPLTAAGLPRTSTVAAPSGSDSAPVGWLALAALGLLGVGTLVGRRKERASS